MTMVYLDYAATCPPIPAVLSEFERLSEASFGNASSKHAVGRDASRLLEKARLGILNSFGLNPSSYQCVFLSGATESNNLAIKGVAFSYKNRGKKIITTAVEHPSVKNAFEQLKNEFGFELIILPVNEAGSVEPSSLEAVMDNEVILVSIMAVNNETGALNDIGALADIVHRYPKAFFHCDVTQGIGKVKVPYSKLDLFSFSAHKVGGLKGNGALVMKKTIRLVSLLSGGDQELGLRGGTVDVAGAYCMHLALKESMEKFAEHKEHASMLKEHLLQGLSKIDEVVVNSPLDGSPYVVNFSLRKHKASVIVEGLSEAGFCVSSISACNSKGEPISYVLLAMNRSKDDASNSIRVSPGPEATVQDIDAFLAALNKLLLEVRPR